MSSNNTAETLSWINVKVPYTFSSLKKIQCTCKLWKLCCTSWTLHLIGYYYVARACKYITRPVVGQYLGADHLTLEGGGGGWFRKKNSCKPLSEEKNCMQHKWNRKKILALLQARKKNVAKLFHHSRGTLQNPSQTATILPLLPLNSGVGYASECAMHS